MTPPSTKKRGACRTRTQAAEWWSPTHRVRRRVFEPYLRRLTMYPPVQEAYGSHVDIRRQRRLCDCALCVRHQQAFLDHDVVADPPSMAGIRFLRLPGIRTTVSSASATTRLNTDLRHHREKILVPCGCRHCVAHRELATA